MLFANPNQGTISKRILGVDYVCPPGEVVEIPDEVAYVIKREGVMLVPADEYTAAKPEKVAATEEPKLPPAKDPQRKPDRK
jgi:hypothetical protein